MQDKPDPIEFYGVLALQNMLHCGGSSLPRKLGEPDGIMRWGCMDAPIWVAEKALGVPCRDIPRMTWYTTNEGSRFVGVTRRTFQRIMPGPLACIVSGNLYANRASRIKPLWTEEQCYTIRRKIKEGAIRVHWRSLTRPLLGVAIVPARHTLASSQKAESEACTRANPFAALTV